MDNKNKNEKKTLNIEPVNKDSLAKSSEELLAETLAEEKAKAEQEKNEKKSAKKERKKAGHKKIKHAALSTILTCVFIAAVVLLNVVCTMLFERYPITIDLTSKKIYSVSKKSEEYIKKIDRDVLVTIFNKKANFENYSAYNKQALEVLKKYSQLNSHISYRFVDIDSSPEIVKDYTDTLNDNDIIFETKSSVDGKEIKRTRKLGIMDLLNFSGDASEFFVNNYGMSLEAAAESMGTDKFLATYGSAVESSNAEQAFTSALMTVTDPNPVKVTFLTGRGELAELNTFKNLLTANGYTVDSINITTENISDDCKVIVIPAPKTDYLDAEITKIANFLNNDGKLGRQLIYCGNIQQGNTPNIDEFLAEYGIEVGKGVIAEKDQNMYYTNQFETLVTDLSDSFNQDVQTKNPALLSGYARPVNTLFDEQGSTATEQYAKSSASAYTLDPQTGKTLKNGTQCYFAIGSKAAFDDNNNKTNSSILAFGSTTLLEDTVLSYPQYQNSEYFLSVINGITNKTPGVTIAPKVITGNLFDINAAQIMALKWIFCAGVPIIVLVIGIVVWIKRKNR